MLTCANCGERNPERARFCQAGALLDLARVLRLAGRDQDAAPLASQALALAERKGHRVAAAQARDLLGG